MNGDDIVYKVKAVTADFEAKMSGVAKHTKTVLGTLSAPIKGVVSQIEKIGSAFRGLLPTLSVAAAGYAAFRAVSEGLARGDSLKDTSYQLGITTDALTELGYVAGQSGVSMELFTAAITKMNITVGRATTEGGAAADVFNKLNISIDQLNSLRADERFELLAGAVGKIDDPAKRAAVSMEIFGRSGAKLNQLFKEGSEGIKAAREEARALGLVVTQFDAERIGIATDAFEKLKTVFATMGTVVASELAPVLKILTDRFVDLVTGGNKFRETVKGVVENMVFFGSLLSNIGQGFKLVWQSASFVVVGALELILSTVNDIVSGFLLMQQKGEQAFAVLKGYASVFWASLKLGWAVTTDAASMAFLKIKESFGEVVVAISKGIKFIDIAGTGVADSVKKFGDDMVANARTGMQSLGTETSKATENITDELAKLKADADSFLTFEKPDTGPLQEAVNALKTAREQAMAEVAKTAEDLMNADTPGQALEKYRQQKAIIDAQAQDKATDFAADQQRAIDRAAFDKDALQNFKDRKAEEVQALRDAEAEKASIYDGTRDFMEQFYTDINILETTYNGRLEEFRKQRMQAELDEKDATRMLWEADFAGKMQTAGNFFGYMMQLQNTKSKELFQVGKVAAIASAIVDTYAGANKALASVPYPFNIAAAGAVVAAGFANVARIRAQSFGGGGGGGSGGGSAPSAGGGGSSNLGGPGGGSGGGGFIKQVNVNLTGQSFSSNQVRQLMEAISKEAGDNFALKTNINIGSN